MSASYDVSYEYNLPALELYERIVQTDFLQNKFEALGSKDVSVKAENKDGVLTLNITRSVPANVPGFAKKILGEFNHSEEVHTWKVADGVASGHYEIDIKGTPINISGDMTIKPKGNGSVHNISTKIEAKIPLIGGKIANFLSNDTKDAVQKEYEYTKQLLEG